MPTNSVNLIKDQKYAVIVDGINMNDVLEDLNITWRIDDLCRTFSATFQITDDRVLPDISSNDPITIYFYNKLYFIGFIEVINPNYDKETLQLQCQGRSKTCDVVDTTVGSNIEFKGKTSLLNIIARLNQRVSSLGVKIVTDQQNIEETLEDEQFKATPDTPLFDFIDRLARRFGLFVVSQGDGNILLTVANGKQKPSFYTIHKYSRVNDLLISESLDANITSQDRFYEYRVHGKNSGNQRKQKVDKDNIYATASSFDEKIRKSRVLDIMMETDTTNIAVLQKRADWEKAVRRGRSITFATKVYDLFDPTTGEAYDVNKIMQINDEATKVQDNLLVKGISLDFNKDDGIKIDLEMTSADAFIPEPINDKKPHVKSKKLKKQTARNKKRAARKSKYNRRSNKESFVEGTGLLPDDFDGRIL